MVLVGMIQDCRHFAHSLTAAAISQGDHFYFLEFLAKIIKTKKLVIPVTVIAADVVDFDFRKKWFSHGDSVYQTQRASPWFGPLSSK